MIKAESAPVRLGLGVAGALTLAAVAVAVAVTISQMSIKSALFVAAGVAGALAIAVSGRAKEVLLGGYIIALTYNRQYFSFNDIFGDYGSQGLYWIPADLF